MRRLFLNGGSSGKRLQGRFWAAESGVLLLSGAGGCVVAAAVTHSGWASTVRKIGALTNFDDIAVWIADVAADLAVLGQRLGDELGSSTFP